MKTVPVGVRHAAAESSKGDTEKHGQSQHVYVTVEYVMLQSMTRVCFELTSTLTSTGSTLRVRAWQWHPQAATATG